MMTDLSDRHILITGANTGIGRAAALALKKRGAVLTLACRSREKTEPVLAELRALGDPSEVHFIDLDLASLDSVRAAAATYLESGRPLHVLINNAGVAGQRGITADGFDLAFGINHLGHFLLTKLLWSRIVESAPSRIVNVSSGSHFQAKAFDFDLVKGHTRTLTGLPEYAVSKLANVLFTKSLAKRLEGTGVTSYALHPGVIASDAWRRVPWPVRSVMKMFMKSTEDGAQTTVHCATSPEAAEETGLYYDDCKVRHPSRLAQDEALAETLWEKSEAWVTTS